MQSQYIAKQAFRFVTRRCRSSKCHKGVKNAHSFVCPNGCENNIAFLNIKRHRWVTTVKNSRTFCNEYCTKNRNIL